VKIFVDARNPRYNGSWTYIASVLPKLVQLYPHNEYIVLYDKVHKPLGLKGVDERTLPFLNPALWILWSHQVLPALLEKEKVDIYHSLKQMNSFKSSTKLIYTVHGAHHFVYPQIRPWYDALYWRKLTKAAAHSGDQMIAVSESDKRSLAYWAGIPEDKISVTNLAVTDQFRPIDNVDKKESVKRELDLDRPFLLFVGRVDPYKNLVGMIKAFAHALDLNDTGHQLVIVGDTKGYKSSGIFDMVKRLRISERVVFTGHLHKNLEFVYNLADAFFFPSLYEAFGLAALEAMACGLPVISSPVTGCIDVVGDAGISIDPLNIEAMAEAIVNVLSSPKLRKSLSIASLARASMFSWDKCAHQTFAVYENVYRS